MTPMPIISFLILAIIIANIIIAIPAFRLRNQENKKTGKKPKGHYIGLGMALGIALGMPFGVATDNISLGPALGLPLGFAIGTFLEKKYENKLRPLTQKEKDLKKRHVQILMGILVLGVIVFLVVQPIGQKEEQEVSSFQECIDAGNPAMESYPRQCRHGDNTYTEIISNTEELVGQTCESSTDCKLPMEYAIQSNCPYQAACVEDKCAVACPLWEHSPIPEESVSYEVTCESDNECDCSGWDIENKYTCACLDGQCASIVNQ